MSEMARPCAAPEDIGFDHGKPLPCGSYWSGVYSRVKRGISCQDNRASRERGRGARDALRSFGRGVPKCPISFSECCGF